MNRIRRKPDSGSLRLTVCGLVLLTFTGVAGAADGPDPALEEPHGVTHRLTDARDRGTFNIGPSRGDVREVHDESLRKTLWEFDYVLPKGTYVGVWAQQFPRALNEDAADALRIGVRVPPGEPKPAVTLEIKGERGQQDIRLALSEGWNHTRAPVNWGWIGRLNEVVFVFSPVGAGDETGTMTGSMQLDLAFYRLSFLEKHFMPVRIVMVFLSALVLAAAAGATYRRSGNGWNAWARNDAEKDESLATELKCNVHCAVAIVLTAGTALYIHGLGAVAFLDAGFTYDFIVVGLLGALIAELWSRLYIGRHLTPGGVFLNVLISGLLAAASSPQDFFAVPINWSDIFRITPFTASVAFLLYHFGNAYTLASAGRPMRAIAGSLFVGVPFLFGWLLVIQNTELLSRLTLGLLAGYETVEIVIGRAMVLFGFNLVAVAAIRGLTRRRALPDARSIRVAALVSLGVVVAPEIANWGSSETVAALPALPRALAAVLAAMLAFGGLWGQVYLITGILLDAGKRRAPTGRSLSDHVLTGVRKAFVYSGILLGLLYLVHLTLTSGSVLAWITAYPLVAGGLCGMLTFPLLKTIVESFESKMPFVWRLVYSYRNWVLYARGIVAGIGFAYDIAEGIFQSDMGERLQYGILVGVLASSGVSLVRDILYALTGRGSIQSWRMYGTDGLMGIFVGGGLAFYLDARQVPVILDKFQWYVSAGLSPMEYVTYPLLNRWGRIELGTYAGGTRLLFTESLAGVLHWAVAAWLFAINRVFMQAAFDRHQHPIKLFFSRAGFRQLMEHMIFVLRWGLWMSPIIFTFLRMMPDATWYNQDGAIRTMVATYQSFALSPEEFQAWSLRVFIGLMAFDSLRVLIWMDHMGLRVATLVNLSFIGLNRLDERVARFIGPAAAQHYIPEAVKRFATWAPLLIPFYIPRGEDWDYASSSAAALRGAAGPGWIARVQSMDWPRLLLLAVGAIVVVTLLSALVHAVRRRTTRKRLKELRIQNTAYKVTLKENGEIYSELTHRKRRAFPPEYDVTRRAHDPLHPCGRILFVTESGPRAKTGPLAWPVVGNFPADRFASSRIHNNGDVLCVENVSHGVKTSVRIELAPNDDAAEIWTVTLHNLTEDARSLRIVPYLEWVLNGRPQDRSHTQYARLFPEMQYVEEANAILARQKSTSSWGVLASDTAPDGFHNARVDFIGRARSVWNPRILETFAFLPPRDTAPYPTFDPIGSLLVSAQLPANGRAEVKFLIGCAANRRRALKLVNQHLPRRSHRPPSAIEPARRPFLIGHGEIPPGTPTPYADYADGGDALEVHTPFTPRPFDHAMANAGGHSVMVTNRGLHTSSNVNSQQNRLTPDWPDTTTREVPGEAVYLYDIDHGEWFSPTHEPLRDPAAENTCRFSVDGTAVFRMRKETLETELTVFVPRDDPAGVYRLKIRNLGDRARNLRVSPYFQMVLAANPEEAGGLIVRRDSARDALLFHNPRNRFRKGWAFASMSHPAEQMETRRSRYFGAGRGVEHPFMVKTGKSDETALLDIGQAAAFATTISVPPGGEETMVIVLGQADDRRRALETIDKYKDIDAVERSLEETRSAWLKSMESTRLRTNDVLFDSVLNWLKYQALVERIWARRGFYQTSGAFGYRDQLQDTVNLMWMDPRLARRQILLHAAQQFPEGDVLHWFFTLDDGRTSFAQRSHASDNLLWLVWAVVEYLAATGDRSLLDEKVSYIWSEFPFPKLPRMKKGIGGTFQRSTRSDSVYRHCLRSLDCVLESRMGAHGLPLIQTGDWNDGLDEIGSKGRGESVWLGFFLYDGLSRLLPEIGNRDGAERRAYYEKQLEALKNALEATWRGDRYLRAIHDDGTEIGIEGSGIWEIDALTAAWSVFSGINPQREEIALNAALRVLERENTVLLGWPALRADIRPYLGRSSKYPEGVRENGMYCHGVQWLIRAARILAERAARRGDAERAAAYREATYRLWRKITPVDHTLPNAIEIYGGQPNKQQADVLTSYEPGRMIWNGYTGAAGWLFRQAFEAVAGATLEHNRVVLPDDLQQPRGQLRIHEIARNTPAGRTGD